MKPEDELCLLLAGGVFSPEARERAVGLLATQLRWDYLLDRARGHGLIPLFYRNLRTFGFPGVPDSVQTELKTAFGMNALRNAVLARELVHVLKLLGEAGVPVIPLKGVALAEQLYGDAALRVCWDVDILVSPSSVLTARRVILANGYSSPFSESFFVNHQFHSSADCWLLPKEPKVPYLVELHWTLLHHSSRDNEAIEDLWAEAHPETRLGVSAYALSPEWEFLYLAAHAASHTWLWLKWLVDIHDLCLTYSLDWEEVRKKAERFGLVRVVETTLNVIAKLFGAPLPPGFSPQPLPADLRLFPASIDDFEAQRRWSFPNLSLTDRPSEKLRWVAERLFVARVADYTFFRLPARLSFLYYVLRPLRLGCKWAWLYAQAAYRHVRQTSAAAK